MKKLDWLILIVLFASPLLVKYIIVWQTIGTLSDDSMDGWLGFYGALLGSLITMFVLYRKSFHESELGRLHSVFPFECMAKAASLSEQRLGRRNIFSPSAKIALMVLKAYTGFSDRQLVEHLNGNIHYRMFCGIMISRPFRQPTSR